MVISGIRRTQNRIGWISTIFRDILLLVFFFLRTVVIDGYMGICYSILCTFLCVWNISRFFKWNKNFWNRGTKKLWHDQVHIFSSQQSRHSWLLDWVSGHHIVLSPLSCVCLIVKTTVSKSFVSFTMLGTIIAATKHLKSTRLNWKV